MGRIAIAPNLDRGAVVEYKAVHRGEVPSMRIGRRILVPKAALERYLSLAGKQSAPGQPEPPPAAPS